MKAILFLSVLISILMITARCGTTKEISNKDGAVKHISKSDLGSIYHDAMVYSYEYMFDQQTGIQLNENYVGRFMGGFKGLFLYSSLKEAFSEYSNGAIEKSDDFYDLTAYDKVSGDIMLFKNSGNQFYSWEGIQTLPFHYYNPDVVKWGHENLIIEPTSKIGNQSAQDVYDNVLQRFFRLMTESYLFIESNNETALIEEYKELMDHSDFDAMEFYEQKFENVLVEYKVEPDYSSLQPSMAISFWLRRKIDGSATEFWIGFSKVMNLYDKVWFESKK